MGAAAKPPAGAVAIRAATRLLEPTVAISSTLYLAGPPVQCHGTGDVLFTSRTRCTAKRRSYAAFATVARSRKR